jgi:uncharacterized protein
MIKRPIRLGYNQAAMISIDEARIFYDDADSAHDFDHILRVLAMAEKLARAEGADVEIVRAAALLHDLARHDEDHAPPKDAKGTKAVIDHADASAEDARALLLQKGAGEDFAARVADAIRAHRFRGTRQPASLEAKILFDADKLDAIGAIGVARAYAVAGSLNQKLFTESAEPGAATREQHHSGHSPVAEFDVKLSKLRERFFTPTARAWLKNDISLWWTFSRGSRVRRTGKREGATRNTQHTFFMTLSPELKRALVRLTLEIIVYALLVVAYLFLVLTFLGGYLFSLFHTDLVTYAAFALGLMVFQGLFLETVTTFLIDRLNL